MMCFLPKMRVTSSSVSRSIRDSSRRYLPGMTISTPVAPAAEALSAPSGSTAFAMASRLPSEPTRVITPSRIRTRAPLKAGRWSFWATANTVASRRSRRECCGRVKMLSPLNIGMVGKSSPFCAVISNEDCPPVTRTRLRSSTSMVTSPSGMTLTICKILFVLMTYMPVSSVRQATVVWMPFSRSKVEIRQVAMGSPSKVPYFLSGGHSKSRPSTVVMVFLTCEIPDTGISAARSLDFSKVTFMGVSFSPGMPGLFF